MVDLVSVIMPTCKGRERFVAKAIDYFIRQDWRYKELLIVGDSDEQVEETTAFPVSTGYPGIYRIDIALGTNVAPFTTGKKRNIASSFVQGEIIVLQDDDDIFNAQRLTKQVEPILRDDADVTAMKMSLLYDASSGNLYSCSDDFHASLFSP